MGLCAYSPEFGPSPSLRKTFHSLSIVSFASCSTVSHARSAIPTSKIGRPSFRSRARSRAADKLGSFDSSLVRSISRRWPSKILHEITREALGHCFDFSCRRRSKL
ncbi:hypothetical protein BT93_A2014 [Corymbia citriodora subsp. variegata]|nr:hypothetical protein BT93_A2014 [Corymbia citriodora subsp. variegata]